jgi:hypothetical protein
MIEIGGKYCLAGHDVCGKMEFGNKKMKHLAPFVVNMHALGINCHSLPYVAAPLTCDIIRHNNLCYIIMPQAIEK